MNRNYYPPSLMQNPNVSGSQSPPITVQAQPCNNRVAVTPASASRESGRRYCTSHGRTSKLATVQEVGM